MRYCYEIGVRLVIENLLHGWVQAEPLCPLHFELARQIGHDIGIAV